MYTDTTLPCILHVRAHDLECLLQLGLNLGLGVLHLIGQPGGQHSGSHSAQ